MSCYGIPKIGRRTIWQLGAVAVAVLLFGGTSMRSSIAAEPLHTHVLVYAQGAPNPESAAAAAELLTKARTEGHISVFVGLRTVVLPPGQVTSAEARQQADDLRAMQDSLAGRVLGESAGSSVSRFLYV